MNQRFSFENAPSGRWGLYGGTFDPIHQGHLYVARCVMESMSLSGVIFMPSGDPPHKLGQVSTPAGERLNMVRLAIESEPDFYYTDYELLRPGPNFSYLTCEELSRKLPLGSEMVFIIGGDSLIKLPTWRYPERVIQAMPLAVVYRPGISMEEMEKSRQAMGAERITLVPCEGLEASSTDIRAGDLSQVPDAVADYICQRRLYGYEPR